MSGILKYFAKKPTVSESAAEGDAATVKSSTSTSGPPLSPSKTQVKKASSSHQCPMTKKEVQRAAAKRHYEATKRKRKFLPHWLDEFDWLTYEEESQTVFCRACRLYPGISSAASSLVKGALGENMRHQTLQEHHNSTKHMMAISRHLSEQRMEAGQVADANPIFRSFRKLDEQTSTQLNSLMNTAFYVCQEKMPMRKFEGLCALQVKNGVQIGEDYRHEKACRGFVESIAAVQRDNLAEALGNARFFSVIADGATDAGIVENETVFVRLVDESTGSPSTIFADIKAVTSGDAAGVLEAIDSSLETCDISIDDQKTKLLMSNFDGASVNMGRKNGVGAQLTRRVPHHFSVQCVAHKMELACIDTAKNVPYLSQFDDVINTIFKFYYYSPKKRRELSEISSLLDEDPAHYGGIRHVRWLACRNRALKAVEKHYATTVTHLQHVGSGKGDDAAKARGLLKSITSVKWVTYLHFMLDYTTILANLSVKLQANDLLISDVARQVETTMLELEELKALGGGTFFNKLGQNLSHEDSELSCGRHGTQSVKLTGRGDGNEDRFESFIVIVDACIKYLDERFASLQQQPVSFFKVFDHTDWPTNRQDLALYGRVEIQGIVDHFGPLLKEEEKEQAIHQWAALKMRLHHQRMMKPLDAYSAILQAKPAELASILVLVKMMMTISASTAECERSFSAMNQIKTNKQTNMSVDSLSSRMRVACSSDTLDSFNPVPAVQSWLSAGKRKRKVMWKGQPSAGVKRPRYDEEATAVRPAVGDEPLLPEIPDSGAESDE